MKTIVITTRHPDHANHHEVFEGDEIGVEIVDIDLGAGFDGQCDSTEQWESWSGGILAHDVSPEWPTEIINYVEGVVADAHPDAD